MGSNGVINLHKILVSTGNIMAINDITRKPSQNSTEELIDAIKHTLKEYAENGENIEDSDLTKFEDRANDVRAKISENDINDLKIGMKVFVTNNSEVLFQEALDTALKNQLGVEEVSDVIITFKKESADEKDNFEDITNIWRVLEEYVRNKSVQEIGIADVEESTFRALYDIASIKPSILQINLATCCVVPPTLQQFCREKDIKLLTHSDSSDILPNKAIQEIFRRPLDLLWAVRFTVHIKCRGVLATKGCCLCLSTR